MSIRRLLQTHTHADIAAWQIIYRREPWGHEWEKRALGRLLAQVQNWSGRVSSKWVTSDDFFPKPIVKRVETPEIVRAWLSSIGAVRCN